MRRQGQFKKLTTLALVGIIRILASGALHITPIQKFLCLIQVVDLVLVDIFQTPVHIARSSEFKSAAKPDA